MLDILIIILRLLNATERSTLLTNRKTQPFTAVQKAGIHGYLTFSPVQKYPHFPGGIQGWKRYLQANLQYPQAAINHNIEAILAVQLTIQTNGDVTNVQALHDPGYGLGFEAVRVIKESPTWRPAFKDGRPAAYRFIQTITFQLQ